MLPDARTDGRTSRKHNASATHKMGGECLKHVTDDSSLESDIAGKYTKTLLLMILHVIVLS